MAGYYVLNSLTNQREYLQLYKQPSPINNTNIVYYDNFDLLSQYITPNYKPFLGASATSTDYFSILINSGTPIIHMENNSRITFSNGNYIVYDGSFRFYLANDQLILSINADITSNIARGFGLDTDSVADATVLYLVNRIRADRTRAYISQESNSYSAQSGAYLTAFKQFFADIPEDLPTSDPYAGAGDSTTGGGDGTFDGSSDPVPVPNLPSVGAQDSGFITLFTPTASQMKDLAHYMWVNPLFDIETGFKKLFSDPMDCILGLSVVPVTIPTSGAKNVNIGNLVTSVTMNVASQQYIEVDCGTVTMDRFFGSYLDFEPYTKIAIFLPYCGTHALSMDDIAGKTIGVVYHIDILTGSCIAFVKCGDSVLYEFNGACGSNIPVNSLNFASTIENAIRIAVNIGTTVATAGASAPATTATELARQKAMNTARNISLAGSTAEGALSLKPSVSRSGALGGGVGILGHQIPYFIITRPRLCKPAKQDFFQGYPSFIQTTIGDLIGKGFTSFTNVIISGQYLTDEEETELENILESGVYL